MPARQCLTIMFVNDDPSFIDIVGDALRAGGLTVLLVPGVPQAVDALDNGFRPDAILLDVLRRGDARDLVETVSRNPELQHVPVIATAREHERLVQIAPDARPRPLPVPSDAREFARLLHLVCARAANAAAARRAFNAHL